MDKGAHFYNCDFQVHSPRDKMWKGEEAVTDEEREIYADEFVKACREKKINAVAITDHHDLVFYKYIKEAAEREVDDNGNLIKEEERLVVFPGMELTLSSPNCQALLILNPSLTEDNFNEIMAKLSIVKTDSSQSKLGDVIRISSEIVNNLNDLNDKLNQLPSVKNNFIILPNVSKGGEDTLLRRGFQDYYKQMDCIAGYVDGKIPASSGWKNIVNGKEPTYGYKEIAVIQTSDNRNRNFDKLGKHTSWIKWSVPTIEALRQAFLAKNSRVLNKEPKLPKQWIESIEISDSKFFGSLFINFNRQYNAVIGGRGTGKSTILEYIRWALFDSIVYDAENPVDSKRKSIIETLTGNIKLVFYNNNVRYVLKREKDKKPILKIGDADFDEVEIDFIKQIFPIQAYSQKQLSSVSNNAQEIDRLIKVNIEEKRKIDNKIKITKETLKTKYEEVIKLNDYQKEKKIITSLINSLNEEKKQLELKLVNITPEQQQIIELKDTYIRNGSVVENILEDFNAFNLQTEELEKIDHSYVFDNSPMEIDKFWNRNKEDIKNITKDINEKVEEISTLNRKIIAFKEKLQKDWDDTEKKYEEIYKEIDSENSKNKKVLEKILEIDKEINKKNKEVTELNKKIEELKESKSEYNNAKIDWVSEHREHIELSKKECEKISSLSNEYIYATVKETLEEEKYTQLLKKIFTGTRISEEKWREIIRYINEQKNPITTWLELLEEISSIINSEENIDITEINTRILEAKGVTDKEKYAIKEKIKNDNIEQLLCTQLSFKKTLEYVVNKTDGERIPFENASAGQQATALLYILLNQDGEPLLIDQPEDDIDSNAINEIIELIWKCKENRQIIFVSHNANMVVNGDAELILTCDYRDDGNYSLGKIKADGAIDEPKVKSEITSIMEGGERAFKLRQAKYGF